MRRKERERDAEFAFGIVDKCEYAVLATINNDVTPYCIPVSIIRIDDDIYFHCAMEGQKTDNMKRNPQVCMTCVGDTYLPPDEFTARFESAVVYGTASEVTDDAEKITVLKPLCEKYTPTNMADFDNHVGRFLKYTAIWKIHIDKITGKSSF